MYIYNIWYGVPIQEITGYYHFVPILSLCNYYYIMDVHRPTIIMLLDYLIYVMLVLINMRDKKKK